MKFKVCGFMLIEQDREVIDVIVSKLLAPVIREIKPYMYQLKFDEKGNSIE